MKKILDSLVLLALLPITVFLSPFIFDLEYRLFTGETYDPGIAGVGYFGLVIPMLMVVILTLAIFVLIKRKIPENFEYASLSLIYLMTILAVMNPLVVNLLSWTLGF